MYWPINNCTVLLNQLYTAWKVSLHKIITGWRKCPKREDYTIFPWAAAPPAEAHPVSWHPNCSLLPSPQKTLFHPHTMDVQKEVVEPWWTLLSSLCYLTRLIHSWVAGLTQYTKMAFSISIYLHHLLVKEVWVYVCMSLYKGIPATDLISKYKE